MKNLFTTLFLVAFYAITSFGQSFSNPGNFNNFIVNEQNKITSKNLEYISFSVHSDDYMKIEKKRQGVINQIQSSLSTIGGVSYEEGSKMQEEAIAVMKLYLETFQVDFPEALALKQTSQESYEAMESYFKIQNQAERKLQNASKRFQKAQLNFAKKHDMKLSTDDTDSKVANQIETINEVNEYSRRLYLINFKLSKANAAFMDALNEQKTGALDSKRVRLLEYAQEALKTLNTIEGFKGDAKYKDVAVEIAQFYAEMATTDLLNIVNVSKKKQSELTQEDVDSYNEAINKYNTDLPKLLDKFNNANSRLLQKNIPNMGASSKIKRT